MPTTPISLTGRSGKHRLFFQAASITCLLLLVTGISHADDDHWGRSSSRSARDYTASPNSDTPSPEVDELFNMVMPLAKELNVQAEKLAKTLEEKKNEHGSVAGGVAAAAALLTGKKDADSAKHFKKVILINKCYTTVSYQIGERTTTQSPRKENMMLFYTKLNPELSVTFTKIYTIPAENDTANPVSKKPKAPQLHTTVGELEKQAHSKSVFAIDPDFSLTHYSYELCPAEAALNTPEAEPLRAARQGELVDFYEVNTFEGDIIVSIDSSNWMPYWHAKNPLRFVSPPGTTGTLQIYGTNGSLRGTFVFGKNLKPVKQAQAQGDELLVQKVTTKVAEGSW